MSRVLTEKQRTQELAALAEEICTTEGIDKAQAMALATSRLDELLDYAQRWSGQRMTGVQGVQQQEERI